MLTLLGGGPGEFAVVAAAHHVVGGDVGGIPIRSVAGLWHLMSTVIVPAALIGAAFVSTFFSTTSPASSRPSTSRADRAPAFAYSLADRPGGGTESGGEGQPSGDRPPVRPVERFYRVTFADERGFRIWAERVVEFTAILQDVFPDLRGVRPVIFVELKPPPGATPRAYVSAGARGLAAHISGGAKVDPAPVDAADLPRGLTMLFGEGVDADEYERRHA